jgi:hypothetical protein
MSRLFDRVKETSTTTGTGDITLAGAVSQFLPFSARFAVGDEQIPYAIVGQTGTEWEVVMGTYSASNTLRRDRVLASSNSDALVNFSAGTKDVFLVFAAEVGNFTGRQAAIARGLAIP